MNTKCAKKNKYLDISQLKYGLVYEPYEKSCDEKNLV